VETAIAPPVARGPEPGGVLAAVFTEGFGVLDERVRFVTRGLLGLGTLLPVALSVWAARELVRGRAAPLAWSSALWYAHGLFRDYAGRSPDA
jgi:hypothetical protein